MGAGTPQLHFLAPSLLTVTPVAAAVGSNPKVPVSFLYLIAPPPPRLSTSWVGLPPGAPPAGLTGDRWKPLNTARGLQHLLSALWCVEHALCAEPPGVSFSSGTPAGLAPRTGVPGQCPPASVGSRLHQAEPCLPSYCYTPVRGTERGLAKDLPREHTAFVWGHPPLSSPRINSPF